MTGATISTRRRSRSSTWSAASCASSPGETLLDIGCGWGAFACHAAQNYGVKVHRRDPVRTADRATPNEKVERLGLDDKVTIELADYALIEGEGRFDKITSIGMFEHVGVANFPTYFKTVHRLLKPGGLFLHHAITRPGGSRAARTGKKRADFAALTRYIFPGGELDYIGRTITNLELHGFEIHDVEGWREHYQRTCRFWHDRLRRQLRRGVQGGRRSDDARLARLSRRLLDHVPAQQCGHLPDAGVEAGDEARSACRRRGGIFIAEAAASSDDLCFWLVLHH